MYGAGSHEFRSGIWEGVSPSTEAPLSPFLSPSIRVVYTTGSRSTAIIRITKDVRFVTFRLAFMDTHPFGFHFGYAET